MKRAHRTKRTRFLTQKRLRALIILGAVLGPVLVVWALFGAAQLTSQTNDSDTQVIRGTVTLKRTSCGQEKLLYDGTINRGGGVCDAGNGLTVGDISVSTGGGALTGERLYYVSDISNIHAGDLVEIRYVLKKTEYNEKSYASTNCKSCYVKRDGMPKERQSLIDTRRQEGFMLPDINRSFEYHGKPSQSQPWWREISPGPAVVAVISLALVAGLIYYVRSNKKSRKKSVRPLMHIRLGKRRTLKVHGSDAATWALFLLLALIAWIVATAIMTQGTFLNALVRCRALPAEIYRLSDGEYYRVPGDVGYGPFNAGSFYGGCPSEIVNDKLLGIPRDPSTEIGSKQLAERKAEKLRQEERQVEAEKERVAEQLALRKELGYTFYVPRGYEIKNIIHRDYRGQEGFDTYGIMTNYQLTSPGVRVTETKVTAQNDSLCATKGDRYSGCKAIAKDKNGRVIERNFKAFNGYFNVGMRIGNTNIELDFGTLNIDEKAFTQKAIDIFNAMKPYDE